MDLTNLNFDDYQRIGPIVWLTILGLWFIYENSKTKKVAYDPTTKVLDNYALVKSMKKPKP